MISHWCLATVCYYTLAARPSVSGGKAIRTCAVVGALCVETVAFSTNPQDG